MYGIIINNQSGKGKKVWHQLYPVFSEMNINYDTYFITDETNFPQIKSEFSNNNYSAIIIIGGDGTIHHTLKLLATKNIPIGIIPAGSGNDFSRALNIPKNSKEALHTILKGNTKLIDLMIVNDKKCATVVGIGFDAEVTEKTNQSQIKNWLNKVRLGKFSYLFGVIKTIFTYQPKNVTISIDNKKESFSNVWLIAVANTPFYGGGLKICPNAIENDGNLNLCIVHSLSRLEIILFFPLVFFGKHLFHRSVATRNGQNIEICCQNTLKVQADGEMLGTTPVAITVEKQKIRVFC